MVSTYGTQHHATLLVILLAVIAPVALQELLCYEEHYQLWATAGMYALWDGTRVLALRILTSRVLAS